MQKKQIEILLKANGKLNKSQLIEIKTVLLILINEMPDNLFVEKIGSNFFDIKIKIPTTDVLKQFLQFNDLKNEFKPSTNFLNLDADCITECINSMKRNKEICNRLGIDFNVKETRILSNKDFERIIGLGFIQSKTNGATSSAKVNDIHGAIAKNLETLIDSNIKIYSAGFFPYYNIEGSEQTIEAYPKTKKVDIVTKDSNDNVISANSIKFPCGNYEQNSYNYLDSLVGEKTRIKNYDPTRITSHALILRSETPYFEKGGVISRIEHLSHETVLDYEKLVLIPPRNPNFNPILDLICLTVVSIKTINGLIPEEDKSFSLAISELIGGKKTIDDLLKMLVIKTIDSNKMESEKVCYDLESYSKKLASLNNARML